MVLRDLSVLSKYMRFASLSRDDAFGLLLYAQRLMVYNVETVYHTRVLDLIRDSSLTSYDCEYVALAEELGAPLITLDKQILKEFPQIAFTPEAYLKR